MITIEEVINMTINLSMRASQAEAKVKELTAEIETLKKKPELKEVK